MKLIRLLIICLSTSSAFAAIDVYTFSTLEQERLYQKLANELRCLVCQNQSIADSNAGLAQDLRTEISKQIRAGKSEAQIIAFMVKRYGDFVLYEPPFKASTLLLWLGPVFILLFTVIAVVLFIRRQQNREVTTLTPQQQQRARELLDTDRDEQA